MSGTRSTIAGKDGNALEFTNAGANCGDLSDIHGLSALTLAVWIKRTSASQIVEFGKEDGDGNYAAIENWSDGKVYVGPSIDGSFEGHMVLNDTNWH